MQDIIFEGNFFYISAQEMGGRFELVTSGGSKMSTHRGHFFINKKYN
jgi:hypothetical protein